MTDHAWDAGDWSGTAVSPEVMRLLAHVNGNGMALLMAWQALHVAEARATRTHLEVKEALSFCLLIGLSTVMVTTIWLEGTMNWWHHWMLGGLYLWSCRCHVDILTT